MQEGPKAAAVTEKSSSGVPVWSRSVGSMKSQLTGLVRPKTTPSSTVTSPANASSTVTCQESSIQNSADSERDSKSKSKNAEPRSSGQWAASSGSTVSSGQWTASTGSTVSTGLAGLGAYSSSSGSDNDEEAG